MAFEPQITVAELKALLAKYPDDMGLYFGGLDFAGLKEKGDMVLFQWGGRSVYEDANGRVIAENN